MRRPIMSRLVLLVVCSLLGVVVVATPASPGPRGWAQHEQVRFFFYNPTRTIECRFQLRRRRLRSLH